MPNRRDVLALPLIAAAPLRDPGPGIAEALARLRSARVSGLAYDLALDCTAADRVEGLATITFTLDAAADLPLDFRGEGLDLVSVNAAAPGPVSQSDGHVVLAGTWLRAGANTVVARFSAAIAASGAAVIRFHDASDGATYLYTLLVPSDASLLFPCFDQPDLKARIRWHLTVPANWKVLANGALERREDHGATATWHMAQTAPISTYLAAFAAGPWASWTAAPPADRPITLYARASRAGEIDAEALIAANRAALGWLERWFAVPFPFAKLDLLLAPAFPFGGMEHVGAVFYNEDSFVWREPPTLPQRLRRDQTIYHEISHQWFGDDVTMRWFDDLWLKEGFATYMAARIQADLQPESRAWTTFALGVKIPAYRTDATRGTRPLWQALDNLDAAKSNYGPIVYNKAPAVIKQLAHYVGEAGLRAGLHLFLVRHALGNATWRDLLGAVGEASGIDLTRFGAHWMLRAGMPLVETRIATAAGRITALELTQRPARALPGDPGGYWPMQVKVRLGYPGGRDVVLDARFEGTTLALPGAVGLPRPAYVFANDEDHGYGLFLPDPESLGWIERHVGSIADPLLRALLWGAAWDAVRECRLDPARFIRAVLRDLPDERDEQISRALLSRAGAAIELYLPPHRAAPLRAAWEPALIARMRDAALGYGLAKDALAQLIATAQTPPGLDALRALLAGQPGPGGTAIGQPTRWAIVRRLITLGTPDASAALAAETMRDHSTEAAHDAFVARAATPDAAAKHALFARFFDDAALNEAWVADSLLAFNPVAQSALTLPLLRPALDRLEWIRRNRRIFFLPAWIEAFIGGQTGAAALGEVDGWLTANPGLSADIRAKVLTARDELARTVRIRDFAGRV